MDGGLATNLLLGLIAVANLILLYVNSRGDREEKLSSTLLNLVQAASELAMQAGESRKEAAEIKQKLEADRNALHRAVRPSERDAPFEARIPSAVSGRLPRHGQRTTIHHPLSTIH